jgi:hypothetical protein
MAYRVPRGHLTRSPPLVSVPRARLPRREHVGGLQRTPSSRRDANPSSTRVRRVPVDVSSGKYNSETTQIRPQGWPWRRFSASIISRMISGKGCRMDHSGKWDFNLPRSVM